MVCTPDAAPVACRGIQYTFACYTIALALAGAGAQLLANHFDVRARPVLDDADLLSEAPMERIKRKNARSVDRRLGAMLGAAWLGLSIALVISAVLSSLTINFPWFYRGGVAALCAPLALAAIPFVRYHKTYRPRLSWLRGIFTDDLQVGMILESSALSAIEELLTLSPQKFGELKEVVRNKQEQRRQEIRLRQAPVAPPT